MAEVIVGSIALGMCAVEINRQFEDYRKRKDEDKEKEERLKELQDFYHANPTQLVFRTERKESSDSDGSLMDK